MKYAELKKQNKKMKKKIERLKQDQNVLESIMDMMAKASSSIMTNQKNTIADLRNKVYEQTSERNALKKIFKEEIIENHKKENA